MTRLYPPKGAALDTYRSDLRTVPTKDLLTLQEYWAYEAVAFEDAIGVDFEDQSRDFYAFKLREIAAELSWRRRLAEDDRIPAWPEGPRDQRARWDAVKAAIPLAQLIRDLVWPLELKPAGKDKQKMRCPFGLHEDRTPSFTLWPDHFFCFGCGRGGSIFDFYMALVGVPFEDALLALEAAAKIQPTTKPIVTRKAGEERVLWP